VDNKEKEIALTKLEMKGVSRRSFIKYCTAAAAWFGLNYYCGNMFVEAATAAVQKKPVIWLQGKDAPDVAVHYFLLLTLA